MKSFVATVLVVLAAVFCISHVDGSSASEVKSIEKRQVPLPPGNTCTSTELQRRNDSLRCSNASVGQQLLDVFAECGHTNEALRKEQECGRNPRGTFCYELRYNTAVTGLVSSVDSNCFSSSPCDSFCNDSLQQLRDSTGCCANYLVTNTYFQPGQDSIFDPWSNCDLQPPNNCSSTLRFVRNQNEQMVCEQSDIAYRINRLFCNPDYIRPLINIMRSCGHAYEETAQSMINNCGVNRYERFCFETQTSQLVSDLQREVQSQCFVNASTCPILCKIALDTYRTGADCCLNNLYNNTRASAMNLRTTSHVLWSFCGMNSPGFCQNTIDSSSAYSIMLQVSVAVTGLSAIIALVVNLI